MAFSTLILVLAVCMLTCAVQVSAGPVLHPDTPVTPRPVTTEYLDEYGTETVGPIKEPEIPSSPIPRSTQYLDDLSITPLLEPGKEPDLPSSPIPRTTQYLDAISARAIPEIIKEQDRPGTTRTRTTKWLNAISTKAAPELMVTTGMATEVREVVPRPAGPGQTTPKLSNGVSDRVMTLFLVAVGFFFVSLIWHLYIRVGWDRDGVKQLDKRAVGAMKLGRLASANQGDVESRGKRKARGAGLWLNEANKVS